MQFFPNVPGEKAIANGIFFTTVDPPQNQGILIWRPAFSAYDSMHFFTPFARCKRPHIIQNNYSNCGHIEWLLVVTQFYIERF